MDDVIKEIIAKLKSMYPDQMHLDDKDAFERGKDAGKVELVKELEEILEEVLIGK